MNERINELIKQSYVTVRSQNDRDVTYFSQEKFAELIVREYLSYAKDGDIDFMKFMIKQHFGVE